MLSFFILVISGILSVGTFIYLVTENGLEQDIYDKFDKRYKTSCAKQDIEALKSQVEILIKELDLIKNPPKKLTKKEQKIQSLQNRLEVIDLSNRYVVKTGFGNHYGYHNPDLVLEANNLRLQLKKLRGKQI
jgi:hypothetical protein